MHKKFVTTLTTNSVPSHATSSILLHITATAAAAALMRVARAARSMTMTRAVDFASDDDAVGIMAMMMVDKQGQKGSEEEEKDVPSID